jgi:hypothetical protein
MIPSTCHSHGPFTRFLNKFNLKLLLHISTKLGIEVRAEPCWCLILFNVVCQEKNVVHVNHFLRLGLFVKKFLSIELLGNARHL